jgi:hypothetical protein
MSKIKKEHRKSFVSAKLIFYDWGWRENVIYRVKASCNEKNKGLLMIDAIRNYFGINNMDEKEHEEIKIKREVRAIQPIKWTRDEKGQIVSRFAKKLKEDFK